MVAYSFIEFLLWLISHIHLITESLLHTTVCCRKCVPVSVCMHSARFHGVRAPSSHTCIFGLCCMFASLLKCILLTPADLCYQVIFYLLQMLHNATFFICCLLFRPSASLFRSCNSFCNLINPLLAFV